MEPLFQALYQQHKGTSLVRKERLKPDPVLLKLVDEGILSPNEELKLSYKGQTFISHLFAGFVYDDVVPPKEYKVGEVCIESSHIAECREENGDIYLRRWFNSLSGWAKEVTNGKGSSGWKIVEARGKKMKEHRKKVVVEEVAKRKLDDYQLDSGGMPIIGGGSSLKRKITPEDFNETKRPLLDLLNKISLDLRGQNEWDEAFHVEDWGNIKSLDEMKTLFETKREWVRFMQFYHYLFGNPEPIIQINFPDQSKVLTISDENQLHAITNGKPIHLPLGTIITPTAVVLSSDLHHHAVVGLLEPSHHSTIVETATELPQTLAALIPHDNHPHHDAHPHDNHPHDAHSQVPHHTLTDLGSEPDKHLATVTVPSDTEYHPRTETNLGSI